jgi:hypothetical protein
VENCVHALWGNGENMPICLLFSLICPFCPLFLPYFGQEQVHNEEDHLQGKLGGKQRQKPLGGVPDDDDA